MYAIINKDRLRTEIVVDPMTCQLQIYKTEKEARGWLRQGSRYSFFSMKYISGKEWSGVERQ
jgi:hypothetical protein